MKLLRIRNENNCNIILGKWKREFNPERVIASIWISKSAWIKITKKIINWIRIWYNFVIIKQKRQHNELTKEDKDNPTAYS